MMRVIKFRAKAAVNDKRAGIKKGGFVYGCFVESGCDAPCIIFGDGEQIEIERESVAQYIGENLGDGTDIYEGDNVRYFIQVNDGDKHWHLEVISMESNHSNCFKNHFAGGYQLVSSQLELAS